MTTLADRFSRLTPGNKALFLARVVHETTIYARTAYIPLPAHPERSFDHPDPIILRDANEFVHRVAGYTSHVLKGTEGPGQDKSVMDMIEHVFDKWGAFHRLDRALRFLPFRLSMKSPNWVKTGKARREHIASAIHS